MSINNISKVVNLVAKEAKHLTRGEKRIADHINSELANGCEFILSKKTYNLINNFSVLNNSERNNFDTAYFGALGRRLIEVFIRKYLICAYPSKNTFFLTLYDKALRSYNSITLQKAFNFEKLVKVKPQNGFERENIANRFYTIFSMIYSSLSIDNVEKILIPLIKKGIKSDNPDFLLSLLHGFYKDKLNKKFVINVVQENDGKYTAICKVGEQVIDKVKDSSYLESRKLLLKKMLSEYNLYSVRSYQKLNKNIFDSEEISPLVDKILTDIGFLDEETKKLIRTHNAKDIIFRAFNPKLKVNNSITFQKLEFYGDAVSNMLIEKFLLEKNLPINEKVKYYAILKSNNTFSEFFDKLELETYLYSADIWENPKLKADTFEALIGALHLSYSEKAVYKFIKPLLEDAYNKYK